MAETLRRSQILVPSPQPNQTDSWMHYWVDCQSGQKAIPAITETFGKKLDHAASVESQMDSFKCTILFVVLQFVAIAVVLSRSLFC
ncbi:MAG: hypothetical protein MUC48_24005 [Leptolyngbya sp. Prado105]|nr:hypothetical protein [Leptolyngbya sp. Prado105]